MIQPSQHLHGEVRVVEDPAAAYATVVLEALAMRASAGCTGGTGAAAGPFRMAISGGASGEACLRALLDAGLAWEQVEIFFADERCVPLEDPQSNAGSLAAVLGVDTLDRLAGWHPMSCAEGPAAYERLLRERGRLDLAQLGFGPDGHTASLFPGSPGLAAEPGALVVDNTDLTGNNPLKRMTLTLEGIATARTVVIVVSGAEKRDALARVLDGEELPVARVRADHLVWLIDEAATAGLSERLTGS